MSSKQQNDQNLYNALSMFNSQVVCTVFSENRQQSTPTKPASTTHDNGTDRRSSAPSNGKEVGSNRFFIQTKK